MARQEVEVLEPRPSEALIRELHSQMELEASMGGRADIGMQLAMEAIDRIASATTLDDVFAANAASSLPSTEAIEGKPLTILEVNFQKPREEFAKGGVGSYAYVKANDDLGEVLEFTTGSPNVVVSLYKIQKLGLLGQARIVIKGRKTTNGVLYQVLKP